MDFCKLSFFYQWKTGFSEFYQCLLYCHHIVFRPPGWQAAKPNISWSDYTVVSEQPAPSSSTALPKKEMTLISKWKNPPVLSYDFPGSFRNGKYAEDNSGQERTKSGTLPVTDKDLASTYVLCHLSPTCPWFRTERKYSWSEVRKEGKLSRDSKLTMTRQVLDV